MSLKPRPRPMPALLLMLALLLTGCGSLPSLSRPAPQALIPPLPPTARQPDPPDACSPTCSDALSRELQSWPITLTPRAPQDKPAKRPTTQSEV